MNYIDTRMKFISLIRVITTVITLYYTNLNIMFKMCLVYIFDMIDCKYTGKYDTYVHTKNYQYFDKITDMVCYGFMLHYVRTNSLLPRNEMNMISIFYFYRLVGVIAYLKSNKREYLFLFPNYFLEITLFFLWSKDRVLPQKEKIIYFIIFAKIIQEYNMHYKYKSIQ